MTAPCDLVAGDFAGFFAVPFRVYAGTPYVSPMRQDLRRMLDGSRNPLFRDGHAEHELFTVRRAGRPVGRVVAHVHHAANRRFGTRRGSFGFFDCDDDPGAAALLLDAAERWCAARGCDEIVGNLNLTPAQQIGVLTGGFEHQPYVDQVWNPPHVPRLLAAAGYDAFFPMSTFEVDLTRFDPASLVGPRQRDLLASPALTWRLLRRRGFRRLMSDTREVLNAAFAANPLFVPVSEAEFLFQVGEMMWLVDERLSPIAYAGREAAGVVVCIPDFNPLLRDTRSRLSWRTPLALLRHRLARHRALVVFGAVRPEWQNRGLVGALLHRVFTALRATGYRRAGITWVSDENGPSLRQMERLGAERRHRLHLFRKTLARR